MTLIMQWSNWKTWQTHHHVFGGVFFIAVPKI